MANPTRPRVTKITVEFDNGATTKTYPDENGYMPAGLFWENGTFKGTDILGAYYKYVKTDKWMEKKDLEKQFGADRAAKVLKGKDKINLTQEVVDEIWGTTNNDDTLPGVLSKDPACDVGS